MVNDAPVISYVYLICVFVYAYLVATNPQLRSAHPKPIIRWFNCIFFVIVPLWHLSQHFGHFALLSLTAFCSFFIAFRSFLHFCHKLQFGHFSLHFDYFTFCSSTAFGHISKDWLRNRHRTLISSLVPHDSEVRRTRGSTAPWWPGPSRSSSGARISLSPRLLICSLLNIWIWARGKTPANHDCICGSPNFSSKKNWIRWKKSLQVSPVF